ncbi:hypothetical protein EAI_13626 [Harpegnathos saltator]|uniref:Uncharacterized protein n=1 Tax=Harpegnathos saltator TaxID=610380 RepID=E2BDU8_HARSA|nr:hypothetical protein EAI_13626 [Harpegnathos saltator]
MTIDDTKETGTWKLGRMRVVLLLQDSVRQVSLHLDSGSRGFVPKFQSSPLEIPLYCSYHTEITSKNGLLHMTVRYISRLTVVGAYYGSTTEMRMTKTRLDAKSAKEVALFTTHIRCDRTRSDEDEQTAHMDYSHTRAKNSLSLLSSLYLQPQRAIAELNSSGNILGIPLCSTQLHQRDVTIPERRLMMLTRFPYELMVPYRSLDFQINTGIYVKPFANYDHRKFSQSEATKRSLIKQLPIIEQ